MSSFLRVLTDIMQREQRKSRLIARLERSGGDVDAAVREFDRLAAERRAERIKQGML